MLLFQPATESGATPTARPIDARTRTELTEQDYFLLLRKIYNYRNPHAAVGEESDTLDAED